MTTAAKTTDSHNEEAMDPYEVRVFFKKVDRFIEQCAMKVAQDGVEEFDTTSFLAHHSKASHYGLCNFYEMLLKDYGDRYHFSLIFSDDKLRVVNIAVLPKAQNFPDKMLQTRKGSLLKSIREKISENLIWKRFDAEHNCLNLDEVYPYMPRLEKAALIAKLSEWVSAEGAKSVYYAKFRREPAHPHTIFWDLVDPTTVQN